jgi:hypothetical protein
MDVKVKCNESVSAYGTSVMIEISKENQKRDQKLSINKFQEIEQDIGERSWVGRAQKSENTRRNFVKLIKRKKERFFLFFFLSKNF